MQSLQTFVTDLQNKIKQVHWVELLVFHEAVHIGAQSRKKREKNKTTTNCLGTNQKITMRMWSCHLNQHQLRLKRKDL